MNTCCIVVDFYFVKHSKHCPQIASQKSQKPAQPRPFCFGGSLCMYIHVHLLGSLPNNRGAATFGKHGSCHLHHRLRSLCLSGLKGFESSVTQIKVSQTDQSSIPPGDFLTPSANHWSKCLSVTRPYVRPGLSALPGHDFSLKQEGGNPFTSLNRGFLEGRW